MSGKETARPVLVERYRNAAPFRYYPAAITMSMAASAVELLSRGSNLSPRFADSLKLFVEKYDVRDETNFRGEDGSPYGEGVFTRDDLLGLASLNFEVPLAFESSPNPEQPNSYDVVCRLVNQAEVALSDPTRMSDELKYDLSQDIGKLCDVEGAVHRARLQVLQE